MTRSVCILVPRYTSVGTESVWDPATESRFADELKQHGDGWDVSATEDRPDAVQQTDVVLLLSDAPSAWMRDLLEPAREHLMKRTILLQCQRPPNMLNDLEEHHVAGGVAAVRLLHWQSHPEKDTGYGLAGLHAIVKRLGATCASPPFASRNYCIFAGPNAHSLTASLAAYISALMSESKTV